MGISIQNVRKTFGDFIALDDVSLDIASGELVALLGPSGSGKTTLLRIIAGLERPDAGTIMLDGRDTAGHSVRERNVGFMFQHYALFRNMTVFDNVAFGLRVLKRKRRPSPEDIGRRVMELLGLVHLEGLHDRYPGQLSGGQRQRVALARALAVKPSVLLLDEPFGALDAKVRKELRRFMRQLHETIQVTTVFVTHDQEEAMEVADRVVVMSDGAIEQMGTPSDVWHEPKNSFVYDFLGNYNEFEGLRDEHGAIHLTEYDVIEQPATVQEAGTGKGLGDSSSKASRVRRWLHRVAPGIVRPPGLAAERESPLIEHPQVPSESDTPVKLFSRPHEIYVVREANGHNEYISARILHINPAGPLVKLELERRNGNLIQAEVPMSVVEEQRLAKGMVVLVRPKKTRVFD